MKANTLRIYHEVISTKWCCYCDCYCYCHHCHCSVFFFNYNCCYCSFSDQVILCVYSWICVNIALPFRWHMYIILIVWYRFCGQNLHLFIKLSKWSMCECISHSHESERFNYRFCVKFDVQGVNNKLRLIHWDTFKVPNHCLESERMGENKEPTVDIKFSFESSGWCLFIDKTEILKELIHHILIKRENESISSYNMIKSICASKCSFIKCICFVCFFKFNVWFFYSESKQTWNYRKWYVF